jgi:large subunit ribosomal protein L15
MRLPKLRGGAYSAKTPFAVLQLSDIQQLADAGKKEITIDTLIEAGYVRGQSPRVKLLSGGELTTAVTLSVHAASETAKKSLEKAGGTLNLVA